MLGNESAKHFMRKESVDGIKVLYKTVLVKPLLEQF